MQEAADVIMNSIIICLGELRGQPTHPQLSGTRCLHASIFPSFACKLATTLAVLQGAIILRLGY
jgi:hypothetical protein